MLKLKINYNLNNCIEIGPGKGAITKLILPIFHPHFRAIEKDTSFEHTLNTLIPEGQIIRNDILQVDLTTLKVDLNSTLVYGSLPYYITSPIISKLFLPPTTNISPLLASRRTAEERWGEGPGVGYWIFIVQKEFAEKIHTQAKKKSYLRRLLNHGHIVTYHKTIKASWFSPAPKVDSAIISITKTSQQAVDYHTMMEVLNSISWFKRKTIGKIIKIIKNNKESMQTVAGGSKNLKQSKIIWDNTPLPPSILSKRLEELSREEIQRLVVFISHNLP